MDDKTIDNVKEYAKDYGFGDDSSSIIIKNLNSMQAPVCQGQVFSEEEAMVSDTRLLVLLFDGSPSMAPVADMLITDFKEVFLPGLAEGKDDMVGALRIGGFVFDDQVTQIWVKEVDDLDNPGKKKRIAFYPLEGLPALTVKEYDVRRGNSTALHQAIITAFTAVTAYAAEKTDETGSNPEITFLMLSDGANRMEPKDPKDARKLVSEADRSLITFGFFGFETDEPVDFEQIAKGLGFRDNEIEQFKAKPGETPAERRRRFRRFIKVFSQSGSQNMPAAQAAATTTTNGDDFFGD